MAKLLGNILPWGTGGSWVFKYGDAVVGNFEKESFLVSDYGSSAKAKAAALKYQKDPKLRTRLKNNSITGKLAKQYGLTYDQYEALPQAKRTELAVKTSRDKIRNIKIEEGGFEQTFKHKGKTYTIPTKFPKDQIPKSPKVPVFCALVTDRGLLALSSIRIMFFCLHNLAISSISQGIPA